MRYARDDSLDERKTINKKTLDAVYLLSSQLLNYKQIAAALGIPYPTFYKLRSEHPELCGAIYQGRKDTRDKLLSDALRMAEKDGNMAQFFLKTKFGFIEEHQKRQIDIKREQLKLEREKFEYEKQKHATLEKSLENIFDDVLKNQAE